MKQEDIDRIAASLAELKCKTQKEVAQKLDAKLQEMKQRRKQEI